MLIPGLVMNSLIFRTFEIIIMCPLDLRGKNNDFSEIAEVEKLNILTIRSKDWQKGNQSDDTHTRIKSPNQWILIEEHFDVCQAVLSAL